MAKPCNGCWLVWVRRFVPCLVSTPGPGCTEALSDANNNKVKLRFEHAPRESLERMHPGYFALVMATGIVALAARLQRWHWAAEPLFWLNTLFLLGVVGATIIRMARYRQAFVEDLQSHSRAVGFYTTVAAFGVFGVQLVLQRDALGLAIACLIVTGILWMVTIYGVLAALTVKQHKPDIKHGLNGSWLVSVVATQSVAILAVFVLSIGGLPALQQPLMFLALIFWLGGGALYLWLMTLIFFRYTFIEMTPEDLSPPYWINMGAVAISALAGTVLIEYAPMSPVVTDVMDFLKGMTLFFWAIGSWWIPMLLVLGVWRYLIRGVPFRYDPLYWGGVFPLGMYAVCTFRLTQVLPLPFLTTLSKWTACIALLAWLATLIGLIDSLAFGVTRRSPVSAK